MVTATTDAPSRSAGLRKPTQRTTPQHWAFHGAYAPVDEEIFQVAKIREGSLPADLSGTFIRNGPNPLWNLPAETSNWHWFFGAGMVHALRIKDGQAVYQNHYLRTKQFLADQAHGGPVYDKMAHSTSMVSFFGRYMLEKIGLVRNYESGPSNTSLVYHGSKLMALAESDPPLEVRIMVDGQLESSAHYPYKKFWNAHPKIDPATGNLHWMNYDVTGMTPRFKYGVIGPEGQSLRSCFGEVPGGQAVMIHDCGITESYAVAIACPVLVGVQHFSTEAGLWKFKKSHGAWIGLFPRDGASGRVEPVWFPIEPCWIFHLANAWEDQNSVVLVVVRWDEIDMSGNVKANQRSNVLGENRKMLYEYRFDMITKTVEERCLVSDFPTLEFPIVNQATVGRKSRYVWAAGNQKDEPLFHRIVKFDLTDCSSVSYGCCNGQMQLSAGEPLFISKAGAAEDAGYLATYGADPDGKAPSSFLLLSAANLDLLCLVDLPGRVPLGFHSLWVSEEDMASQADLPRARL
ncbi:CCD1 [Symbiodinium sp. CCMP2592]|nr:CCD1 [Symbiodinium sp. CCMP2592]